MKQGQRRLDQWDDFVRLEVEQRAQTEQTGDSSAGRVRPGCQRPTNCPKIWSSWRGETQSNSATSASPTMCKSWLRRFAARSRRDSSSRHRRWRNSPPKRSRAQTAADRTHRRNRIPAVPASDRKRLFPGVGRRQSGRRYSVYWRGAGQNRSAAGTPLYWTVRRGAGRTAGQHPFAAQRRIS